MLSSVFFLPGPLGTRQRYIISKTIHHLEFISVFAITVQLSCVWIPYMYVQNILSPSALTFLHMWNLRAYYGFPLDALNLKMAMGTRDPIPDGYLLH